MHEWPSFKIGCRSPKFILFHRAISIVFAFWLHFRHPVASSRCSCTATVEHRKHFLNNVIGDDQNGFRIIEQVRNRLQPTVCNTDLMATFSLTMTQIHSLFISCLAATQSSSYTKCDGCGCGCVWWVLMDDTRMERTSNGYHCNRMPRTIFAYKSAIEMHSKIPFWSCFSFRFAFCFLSEQSR